MCVRLNFTGCRLVAIPLALGASIIVGSSPTTQITETYCRTKTSVHRQTVKSVGLGPTSKDNNLDESSNLSGRICDNCGKQLSKTTKGNFCKLCYKQKTKIEWPDIILLNKMLEENTLTAISSSLGVSVNAIKKHLRNSSK